jgi:hypothetical protein
MLLQCMLCRSGHWSELFLIAFYLHYKSFCSICFYLRPGRSGYYKWSVGSPRCFGSAVCLFLPHCSRAGEFPPPGNCRLLPVRPLCLSPVAGKIAMTKSTLRSNNGRLFLTKDRAEARQAISRLAGLGHRKPSRAVPN